MATVRSGGAAVRFGCRVGIQVIFNVLILLVVWPWVYIAYRRVLKTLRAKYRGQEVGVIDSVGPFKDHCLMLSSR